MMRPQPRALLVSGVAVAVVAAVLGWLQRRLRRKALEASSARRWAGWGTRPYTAVQGIVSDDSARHAAAFQLRPTDVVILTFVKSGTTFVQQICEQLRTGGDMNFSEISERQPWIQYAWDVGQDLSADQVAFPRIFKEHQRLSAINPGGKYISVIREPGAVLLSFYTFLCAKGKHPFVDFTDVNAYAASGHFSDIGIHGGNVWDYYVELWEARGEPCLLVLCYEKLVAHTREHLPRIASFLGLPAAGADAALLDKVVSMSTKEFMLEHVNQFDDNFNAKRGRSLGRGKGFVTPVPKVGLPQSSKLSADTRAWLDQRWSERVLPRTGHATYAEFCEAFNGGKSPSTC